MRASTQDNIPLAGIKDGIVLLKDGSYRLILEVGALNYDLKSEEEQNSLIFRYQGFLNSLHFPIQIVMQSKKLDLTPYISKLKKLATEQKNELIKIQTEDYVDFVEKLINLANIMKKTFYVTVAYTPLNVGKGSFIDKILRRNDPSKLRISEDEFTHHSKELLQRGQTAASGLGSMGLHCRQLVTEEVIELFYGLYNPEIAGKERLTDASNLSSSMISNKKSDEQSAEDAGAAPTESIKIDNADLVKDQAKKDQEQEAIVRMTQSPDQQGANSATAEAAVGGNVKSDPAKGAVGQQSPEAGEESASKGFDTKPSEVNTQSALNNTADQPAAQAAASDVSAEIKDPALNKNFGW